jgi:hypothetical protein
MKVSIALMKYYKRTETEKEKQDRIKESLGYEVKK